MTRQLSPIEAEAYFLTTLDIWQTKQSKDEPTLEEYRDLAEMIDCLARLKAGSEKREEVHDAFVLPWLEWELPRLRKYKLDQEASSVDESLEAGHTGDVIVALEGLIERAKAHAALTCDCCGQTAKALDEGGRCPACEHTWQQCTLEAMNVALATFTAVTEAALDQVHRDDLAQALAEASPRLSFVDAPLLSDVVGASSLPGEVTA